jgi:hypothetical protein
LKDWLVDAVAATLVQKGTNLTEGILTRTMPHPARRLSLEMEARAGEHRVAMHESESARQFQALLKKPVKASNGKTAQTVGAQPGLLPTTQREQEAVSGGSPPPMPQVTPKPTKQRVGQRAPERDPVGEPSAFSVREPTRCSFAEVIAVTPSQMIEHGVSRFECPTCLAMREIKPRGGCVKFPSHPKRLTTTPNQGARWVKRESIWKRFDA